MDIEHITLAHGIGLSTLQEGPAHGPLTVFLHGFPEGAFIWEPFLRHFAQLPRGGARCVAPDMRGYGLSSHPTDVTAYRPRHLVQDVEALLSRLCPEGPRQQVRLVAHDWGGAVAWNFANRHPEWLCRLSIVNAPHPLTFWRELTRSAQQQQASAYMNFLARPDAPALLAEDDHRRLWPFFESMGATTGPQAWLTPELRERYRAQWAHGLQGPCHYYGASPLRPCTTEDAGAQGVDLPEALGHIAVPTQVIWGLLDTALRPELLDGLEAFIPDLRIDPVPDGSHWVLHEHPGQVAALLESFLFPEQ
jgi:pimeloyl-ACP methyl ester carboxylesterase